MTQVFIYVYHSPLLSLLISPFYLSVSLSLSLSSQIALLTQSFEVKLFQELFLILILTFFLNQQQQQQKQQNVLKSHILC